MRRSRPAPLRALGLGAATLSAALVLSTAACSDDSQTSPRSSTTSHRAATTAPPPVTATPAQLKQFAAAADRICVLTAPKVMALSDPDGVGGNKQLGLGRVIQEWAAELGKVAAPTPIARRWAKAVGLLRRAGVRLEDAERLNATGDTAAAGAAQSEALWSLEAQAGEIALGLGAPFQACFVN